MKELKFDFLGEKALDIMENTNKSLFLTGKAGTGKSTLLKYFVENTDKKIVLLASTGIAAINVGGTTIHKFFRFSKNLSLDKIKPLTGQKLKILQDVDTIIIDEVSMVRVDLLEAIDKCIKISLGLPEANIPFGGKQIIFIGDLYQLPPVVVKNERAHIKSNYKTEYFFSASAYQKLDPIVISLQKIYRQKDSKFKNILNKIRLGIAKKNDIQPINHNIIQDLSELKKGTIILTTTNKRAREINQQKLTSISGDLKVSYANVRGEVPQNFYPTSLNLEFKKQAQVIMLNNTPNRSNGTIAKLVGWDKDDEGNEYVLVSIDQKEYKVEKFTWRINRIEYNNKKRKIEYNTIGKFVQYPFKLARAITIHKSQGLTFDKVAIDFGKYVFAKGQAYVALSRASSLDELHLFRPLKNQDIKVDKRVLYFMGQELLEQKTNIIQKAIAQSSNIKFNYIKSNDEITTRIIEPKQVGESSYNGYNFQALKGFCHLRKSPRTFNLKKIFDLHIISK